MKKRGLASPDALALAFALPVSANWDLPPVQEYCVTECDLDEDYFWGDDLVAGESDVSFPRTPWLQAGIPISLKRLI